MEKLYNKLVRDNIPGIIRKNGETPTIRSLSEKDYWQALLDKDSEELLEVKDADGIDERKKELADKLELIIAMAEFNDFSLQDIIEEADKKRAKNGGFQKRLFLEKAETK